MKTILSAGLIALAAGTAMAGTVQLGVTPQSGGTTAMNSRVKLDTTNWDQLLSNGGSIGGGNDRQTNLGNIDNQTWAMSLGFQVGQGFTFTMTRGATVSTQTWRNDGSDPTLGTLLATDRAFNALRLISTARRNDGYEMSVTNLAFSGVGQTINGAVPNLVATRAGADDFASTAIVSSADMRTFDWTLTGTLRASRGGNTNNPSENLKFDIYAEQNGNYVIIPLPGAAWAGMAGLATLGVAQRIRRRKMA